MAVLRFTLGSDAADTQVPRVVGGVCAALLLVNHVGGGGEPSEAQVRTGGCGPNWRHADKQHTLPPHLSQRAVLTRTSVTPPPLADPQCPAAACLLLTADC